MSPRDQKLKQVSSILAVPFLIGFSASVFATNGILPLGNGMTAHGFGGAGIANPGDAMAGTDNPALLAETGDQMAVGLTLFAPHRSADIGTGAGYVDSDKNLFEIPSFGWTKTLTPKMNTGILVTAMGGMNTTYPATLVGKADFGIDLSGLIIAPTLSYAPDSDVAWGVSALLGYEKLTTTLPAGSDSGTDSATGSGIKLGVSYHFSENTQLGAFWQSRMKMGEMSKHCNGNGAFSLAKALGITCEVNLPPMAGAGFKLNVSENGKLVMDVMHVAWSKVELFRKAFGWEDQNIFKFGYEYTVNSGLAVRYGVNYGPSPLNSEAIHQPGLPPGYLPQYPSGTPDSFPGAMAPAVSERHYAIGFTKKLGNNELVGYYAFIPKVEQVDPGLDSAGNARVKMYQHALGFGFNWK